MKDEIVDEVRSHRDAHAKKYNYDLDAICEDFKTHQQECGLPLVTLEPKMLGKKPQRRTTRRTTGVGPQ